MSEPDRVPPPLEIEQQIDRLCDEFELAWKSGLTPRIEDFLSRLPVSGRAYGLRELLAQEIDLRRSTHELVDCKEYQIRFADNDQIVRDAIALLDERGSAKHGPVHTVTTIPWDGFAETSREVSVDPQSYSDFLTLIPSEYAVKEFVGQGGMGLVIRARHRSLDRDVALKLVRGGCSHERFLREGRLLAKIRSPFVVAVNDYEVLANGTPMLVMEWIDGWDLGKVMKQRGGSISEDEALRWMQQICEGMTAAESQGIIHRDLKPSNIIIDEAGHARVADFGLARTNDITDDITLSGSVMGTPYYMAPEQAEDPQSVDTRADIYSFGATFYHALIGRPPFDGKTPFAILFNHKTEPLVSPRFRRPDLTSFTSELLERCLAKERSARFATFSEIAKLLGSSPDVSPWTAQDDPALTVYWTKYQAGKGRYLATRPESKDLDTFVFPRGKRLIIISGDIVDQQVDVLVSSDTAGLLMEYGVSVALAQKGGQKVLQEAALRIPVRPGRAVVTTAGDLKARFIFHGITVGVIGKELVTPSRDLIAEIISSCFYHADTYEITSIAFPLLGTGAMRFSKEICLDTMFQCLARTLMYDLTSVEEVRIVLFNRESEPW